MSVLEAKAFDPTFKDEVMAKMCTEKNPFDFNNCLTCGMCTAGCPYSDVHEDYDPRKFLRQVALGMKEDVLNSKFIWACTMCGRCTMECPMGVDVATTVRTIRGNFGLRAPGFLPDVVQNQLKTGNQMEVTSEDYLDTLDWMQDELREEVGDPDASIPVDKVGADFLFLWDPREIKYYPQDVQSIAKIFWYVGANWTSSSKWWDATLYPLFNGDDESAKVLISRIGEEVKRLKVKYVVVTECGHATRAQKWGPKVWTKDPFYPVYTSLEMMAKWIKEGKLFMDKTINSEPLTLHDPCNSVRKEGLGDIPRFILKHAVMEVKEMTPHGKANYCCGGGGGLLAMGKEYYSYRMANGKLKADQIKATDCKMVACPCHNCFDQLTDSLKYYEVECEVIHIHHLVSRALDLSKRPIPIETPAE